ncbi:MAG: histidine phosphatase family protein [Deltaproteobacteria bacterium]|nr:histidine phosphatase family protein [Deltaproteobacteria bacterium]
MTERDRRIAGLVRPRTIKLLRHAETAAQHAGCLIGSADLPLAPEGRRKASLLAPRIAGERPARLYCSPLRRARETAEALGEALGMTPEIDPELREIDFGRWEGMTFDSVRESDPEAVDRWARFEPGFTFPGGESIGDFLARVRRAAERMAGCGAAAVLAVTHGGVIRATICHFLGLPPRNYVLFDVKPASLTRLEIHDGKGVLTGLSYPCIAGGE